jgi:hypothetical protein
MKMLVFSAALLLLWPSASWAIVKTRFSRLKDEGEHLDTMQKWGGDY